MSFKFSVRLADRKLDIETIYRYSENLCCDYLCTEEERDIPADIRICTSQEDLDKEISYALKEMDEDIVNSLDPGYLESLALYRKLRMHLWHMIPF